MGKKKERPFFSERRITLFSFFFQYSRERYQRGNVVLFFFLLFFLCTEREKRESSFSFHMASCPWLREIWDACGNLIEGRKFFFDFIYFQILFNSSIN